MVNTWKPLGFPSPGQLRRSLAPLPAPLRRPGLLISVLPPLIVPLTSSRWTVFHLRGFTPVVEQIPTVQLKISIHNAFQKKKNLLIMRCVVARGRVVVGITFVNLRAGRGDESHYYNDSNVFDLFSQFFTRQILLHISGRQSIIYLLDINNYTFTEFSFCFLTL